MKKIIILLQFFFTVFVLYADNKFGFFFDSYECTEHVIDGHGWLEHDKLKNTTFSECMMIKINELEEISYMLYYPIGSNSVDLREGMFEINTQTFSFHDFRFDFLGIKILSLSFENKKYLLFLGNVGKYGDKICFIFDISNPEHIIFYPPEKRFICKELSENFIGIYQDKLCFFFSTRRYDWNGEYKLSPYFIESTTVKELCDEKGNPYYINYSFMDRFEQKMMIEEEYIPKGER